LAARSSLDLKMCALCEELDGRIQRCHSLGLEAKDQLMIEAIKLLIEKYEADKTALHEERA
jgi:hypothetical protein